MRIAQAQVVVTAEMETVDGDKIRVRQSTEAEDELAVIYGLLDVNANPIGNSNPWYTQSHLPKVHLLKIRKLREI